MDALTPNEAKNLLIDSFTLLCEIGADTKIPARYKQKIMALQNHYINTANRNKNAKENIATKNMSITNRSR